MKHPSPSTEQLTLSKEFSRLSEPKWRKWGPYLSERQWGTVREDYSPYGTAWEYFSHDMARSRAYRWGEDGIGGICDDAQRLCFALALWNGRDPIIKERLFGLTSNEGNHAEDVKECYYFLDNVPSHSYMKMLYKYPQREYPYRQLVEENRKRGRKDTEFELLDTGIFQDNRYFDVFIEYAKAAPEDILIRISIHNRASVAAELHLLPHLWFRNTWSWGLSSPKPNIKGNTQSSDLQLSEHELGDYVFSYEGKPGLLFCENETNHQRLFGFPSLAQFCKDGINDYVVQNTRKAINAELFGTKVALHYQLSLAANGTQAFRFRLTKHGLRTESLKFAEAKFEVDFEERKDEADEFYAVLQQSIKEKDAKLVQRQAFAGLLWSKQFYYYDVRQWLDGDPSQPPPPASRLKGRNSSWVHLRNNDVISMPDTWEYPWYAAWDLAFHCIPLAMIDPYFAKEQLVLLAKERYMHPNGQLPAYEWAFDDVNPPVHAWATWRVYKIDQKFHGGKADLDFLARVFHKLLLNFTWWVNRKDEKGNNIFQGGFLGLDNIGVFDRSAILPTGGQIEQADGTAWMAMFCLNMMRIALELSLDRPVYQDLASKFFRHFLYIAQAMMNMGGQGIRLWDEEDEFYYDVLHIPGQNPTPLKVRSLVGLIPLFAVETVDPELLERVPQFRENLEWFLNYRPDLASLVSRWTEPRLGERRLLSLLRGHRMKCLLRRMLDETEFLSDYGVRALSRYHQEHPYEFNLNGNKFVVNYQPAESDSGIFGGNSNWRGPIWFPVNYLLIESLQKFHHYYGDDFKIECPTHSGRLMSLNQVASELSRRLSRIFLHDRNGHRPIFGKDEKLQNDPHFRDYILFYEYFHGDSGRGVGASHQTGWTALVAKLLQPRHGE